MKVSATPLALLCACVALEMAVVAAEYMYRPAHGPPHLMHGHGPHGPHGPHKHLPYASKGPGGGVGKHPPPRLPPPPHYHGRPHHRPRKPPPPPLSAASPWKTTSYKPAPYKTTKEPFLLHASDADFGSQAAALSATKTAGMPLTSITSSTSPLLSVSSSRPSLHGLHGQHAYNVVSDDRGPIHTIPAPQLSPADRPSHLAESPAYGGEQHVLQQALQHSLQRQAIQSALSQLSAAQAARPTGPTTAAPVPHHTQGYQVSEPSTASQEGVANFFAPDPDPSRPTPKVRPTTDPYSLPSEGRGPHFSIDPQFGAVSSQPGYMSASASLSPQDLFHLLNGFPLQGLQGLQPLQQDVHGVHGVQPHIQIMPHGLTGDTLLLHHHQQQQQLQQQQYQQQVQAAQSLRQLQPADFHSPQYQSFDFDEQSYQKSLFQEGGQGGQDHEVSEDAPRPSVQRPDPVAQDASPSASTVTLYTVPPPKPTSSTPPLGRAEADLDDEANDEADDDEEYDDVPSSDKQAKQAAATPAPQASSGSEDDSLQQQVVEEAGSYASDPSLVTPFRRQPNSVQVSETKVVSDAKPLPYGARIRPKRAAQE